MRGMAAEETAEAAIALPGPAASAQGARPGERAKTWAKTIMKTMRGRGCGGARAEGMATKTP